MNNRNSNRVHILAAILVLALATIACGFNISQPITKIKTGPTQTVDIQVPMPEGSSTGAELNLEFVGGSMKLAPGASGYLASGTATFNAADFEPKVDAAGSSYTLRQGDGKIDRDSQLQGQYQKRMGSAACQYTDEPGYKGRRLRRQL